MRNFEILNTRAEISASILFIDSEIFHPDSLSLLILRII